jgi:hypothetical protein
MSYHRVLPRDAFNEANLLKCVGRLTLLIEDRLAEGWEYSFDGDSFDIQMDGSDGSISVANIQFKFNGEPVKVFRPMNARDSWPMFVSTETGDEFQLFNQDGELQPQNTI